MAERNTQSITRQDKSTPAETARNTLVPPVDICEDKDGVTLYADLPGVGKDGLDVHVDKAVKWYSSAGTHVRHARLQVLRHGSARLTRTLQTHR